MSARRSIARQAALRLVFSLSLFVALIAVTSAGLYRFALEKAATERADDLKRFFVARLGQLQQEWEN